jgi:hypothetical protein
MNNMNKIIIIGSDSIYGMERSYKLAFESLDFDVEIIDFNNLCNSFIPLKFIQRIGYQVDVLPSITKANHYVAKKIYSEKPYAIMVFTNVKIYSGTIEYFKMFCDNVIFYWPDSIVNLSNKIFSNLKHYNFVYTHSLKNVEIFTKNDIVSKWLPFAGDTILSMSFNKNKFITKKYDFSFVGSYRPERFDAINNLIENFSDKKFLIVGPGWNKTMFQDLNKIEIVNQMVDLNSFLDYTIQSKISLNIIDFLNYPSSNLRFFEIALSSVPQISSFIPEFEKIYIHNEHVFYYKNYKELIEVANNIFNNYEQALLVAINFRRLIESSDNYIFRCNSILSNCK